MNPWWKIAVAELRRPYDELREEKSGLGSGVDKLDEGSMLNNVYIPGALNNEVEYLVSLTSTLAAKKEALSVI